MFKNLLNIYAASPSDLLSVFCALKPDFSETFFFDRPDIKPTKDGQFALSLHVRSVLQEVYKTNVEDVVTSLKEAGFSVQRSSDARTLQNWAVNLSPCPDRKPVRPGPLAQIGWALKGAFKGVACSAFVVFMFCGADMAFAATPLAQTAESPQLQKCLKRADDLPDMAAAEAAAWIKKNGGNDAHLCRAFAQSNRGMHADAAREFWFLASAYEKANDKHRAVVMNGLSGQEFSQAKDAKNAEARFAAALKISPGDVRSLVGRAALRMDSERYWDAIDDLNRALKTAPDDVQALRQRGRAWTQLGNGKNAAEDFAHAAAVAGDDTGAK